MFVLGGKLKIEICWLPGGKWTVECQPFGLDPKLSLFLMQIMCLALQGTGALIKSLLLVDYKLFYSYMLDNDHS